MDHGASDTRVAQCHGQGTRLGVVEQRVVGLDDTRHRKRDDAVTDLTTGALAEHLAGGVSAEGLVHTERVSIGRGITDGTRPRAEGEVAVSELRCSLVGARREPGYCRVFEEPLQVRYLVRELLEVAPRDVRKREDEHSTNGAHVVGTRRRNAGADQDDDHNQDRHNQDAHNQDAHGHDREDPPELLHANIAFILPCLAATRLRATCRARALPASC